MTRVAPMIKSTEAKCRIVVIVSLCVEFFDSVEGILAQLHIIGSGLAALVLVSRNVRSEGLQVAEAVSRDHDVCALPLNDLKRRHDMNDAFS